MQINYRFTSIYLHEKAIQTKETMPQTISKRRTTSTTRSRSRKGKISKGSRCAVSNGAKQNESGIIGNSLFNVNLKTRIGFEVQPAVLQDVDAALIYNDLLPAVKNALLKYKGFRTKTDPYKQGANITQSYQYLIGLIKNNLVPEGWEFNIEKNEHTQFYFLIIYKECDFDSYWHAFEIKPAVKKLKHNEELRDFFLLFMKNFYEQCQIDPWWHGGLCFVDIGWMKERIAEREDDYDDEEQYYKALYEMAEIEKVYQHGEAKYYEKLLMAKKSVSVKTLSEGLQQFSKRNKLVKWMYEALKLMEYPCDVMNFCYPDVNGDIEGLLFDQQVGIIWDESDMMSGEQMETLDAEAQGIGIHAPILHYIIGKENNYPMNIHSFDDLKCLEQWPGELTKIYHLYNEAIK